MATSRDFKAELANLDRQRKAIESAQMKARGNKKFKCLFCDKMHAISKCDAFTFPTFESGCGYEDGRWWEGEIYIRCPETGFYNRAYFNSPQYPNYGKWDYDADMQFKSIYRRLFKSLTEGKDNAKLRYDLWQNNDYFDKNHKKFDLQVKK